MKQKLDEGLAKNLKSLNTPRKIQDFLNKLPINFERHGHTVYSPLLVFQKNKAQCLEGALLAAAALWYHGRKPLLLDLKTSNNDLEHVVALFKEDNGWGAISKTNHAVLRYREPVYKTMRELAMSYFHEYFLNTGHKTMRSFSRPFDLRKYGVGWIMAKEHLWHISDDLDACPHYPILTPKQIRNLRPADPIEIEAGKLTEH